MSVKNCGGTVLTEKTAESMAVSSRVVRWQAEGADEGNDKLDLDKYFCSYLEVISYM
jgi:hypothetical protein